MKSGNPAARAFGGLLLSGMLFVLAGCNQDVVSIPDDTGGDVTGLWTAVSFGGSPLPIQEYIQIPDRGVCLRKLNGVDLLFSTGGEYTWVEEVFLDCGQSGNPQTFTNTFKGTWRVEGVHLFMLDSEDEQTAEQDYTFTVSAGMLSMRVKVGSINLVSLFQRAT
ncbi:MAG: hypothetical protein FIB01_03540 [Gemmatimonadetes bacterium]|nr:hypothetical protein [Gemmatimonadota bacterium]